jgi:hypothetical protein
MERTCTIFTSFEEADRAEVEYYVALRPEERLNILLDLVSRYRESLGEAAEGFERVHRVVELARS